MPGGRVNGMAVVYPTFPTSTPTPPPNDYADSDDFFQCYLAMMILIIRLINVIRCC